MLNNMQLNVLKWAKMLGSVEDIAKAMGKEWEHSQMKIASTITTLARKGALDTDQAKKLLKGTPSEKLLVFQFGSQTKKPFKFKTEKITSTR